MLNIASPERTRLVLAIDSQLRSPGDHRNDLKSEIYGYLRGKVPTVPDDVFFRANFDHEAGLLSSELISASSIEIWACRLVEPDESVPGRSWILEVAISDQGETSSFAGRLSCYSRSGSFDFEPAVPRLYRTLVERGLLVGDGTKLSSQPHDVATDIDVEWLLTLINSPRRWRNVIVVSCDDDGNCNVNIDLLSRRLAGVAHIVRIYPEASFMLSDAVSRHLSVFDRGVRSYRATDGLANDDPGRHLLITRSKLVGDGRRLAELALLSEACRESVSRVAQKPGVLPSFASIRASAATLRLAQSQEAGDNSEKQLEVAIQAKAAAEGQAAEAFDLATQEEQLRREAQEERDQERGRAIALSSRIRELEGMLKTQVEAARSGVPTPVDYDTIPEWVNKQFSGRLRLHGRAFRALKSAQYEDVNLVCHLLELLAVPYVNAKRGEEGEWAKFNNGLTDKGVDLSRSISESRAGEQGKEYFVRVRDRDTLLEWHLKRGTSRSEQRDLRIYFFWDEEDGEVVVGWLPSHLAGC